MNSQQKRNILKKRGIRGKIGNVSPCLETQIAPVSTLQTMELKLICWQVASVKGPPGWALMFTLQKSCQSQGDIAWFNYGFSQKNPEKIWWSQNQNSTDFRLWLPHPRGGETLFRLTWVARIFSPSLGVPLKYDPLITGTWWRIEISQDITRYHWDVSKQVGRSQQLFSPDSCNLAITQRAYIQ